MKKCLLCLLVIVLPFNSMAKTVYPLYAISADYTPLTSEDAKIIAQNFRLFRAVRLKKAEIDALHSINPQLKTLFYINSGSSFAITARYFETNYRTQISMYSIATLASKINRTQIIFKLKPDTNTPIPLKKSTMEGDFSENNKKYVIWIRIDNELMKVLNFNQTTHEIKVARGFSGSTPSAHAVNASVFTTVYVQRRAIPDGTDSLNRLRYSIDVASPFAIKWLVDQTYQAVTELNYDGVWFDVFSANNFNHYNMYGKGVPFMWDFNKKAYAKREEKRELQEIRLNAVQNKLIDILKKLPPIFANRMAAGQYWPGLGNTRLLLMPTQVKPRPLAGYCIENFAGFVNGRGNRPRYRIGNSWIRYMKMLMDASQKGLVALPMVADAGGWSTEIEPAGPIRDAFETYAYASFLIAVEKNSKIMLGIPAYYFYTDQKERKAWLHPRYSWPIGLPTETQAPENILNYQPKGHVIFMRHFDNGLALVNPTNQSDAIKFGTSYYDPDTRQTINSITMAPQTGKVLLKSRP
mgnify:FL=1